MRPDIDTTKRAGQVGSLLLCLTAICFHSSLYNLPFYRPFPIALRAQTYSTCVSLSPIDLLTFIFRSRALHCFIILTSFHHQHKQQASHLIILSPYLIISSRLIITSFYLT